MADSAVQYATPEEKYPVVQVTRTKSNLNYKLYDGQLFFHNETGNEKLYIGNGNNNATAITDYPFFQAGDWKSITGAITKQSGNTYVLDTTAVINALPFVSETPGGSTSLGKYVLGGGNTEQGKIYSVSAYMGVLSYLWSNTVVSNSYKLQGANKFEISPNLTTKTVEMKLGNWDMIKFDDARFHWYRTFELPNDSGVTQTYRYDAAVKQMGGPEDDNIYAPEQYVLFTKDKDAGINVNTADFWKHMTMGVFVTWTEYYAMDTYNQNMPIQLRNTYSGNYTHFIPKIIIDKMLSLNNNTSYDVDDNFKTIQYRLVGDTSTHTTVGVPVTSGLMTSALMAPTQNGNTWSNPISPAYYLGVKTLYITPVGLFGDDTNSSAHTTSQAGLKLTNNHWVLKYVTVI